MNRWEYNLILLDFSRNALASKHTDEHNTLVDQAEELLNRKGVEGWEAVSIGPYLPDPEQYLLVLLKRPKTDDED